MATVNIKVYAVVVYEYDTYSYDGTSPVIQEPLYVSEAAAKKALEKYKANNYGFSSIEIEEYTLQTTA